MATIRYVIPITPIFTCFLLTVSCNATQNNQDALGPVGKKHWENLVFWRRMIEMNDEGPMPINNEKVYGG